jgi:ribose transport system substrate-binding protein
MPPSGQARLRQPRSGTGAVARAGPGRAHRQLDLDICIMSPTILADNLVDPGARMCAETARWPVDAVEEEGDDPLARSRGMRGPLIPRRAFAVGLPLLVAVGAFGYGSAAGGATTNAESSSAVKLSAIPVYSGPESKVAHSFGKPTPKPGVKFTVGWLDPNAEQPALEYAGVAGAAEAKRLGGTFNSADAQTQIPLQVSQFNNFLAEHVNGIIVSPNDPDSLGPDLTAAKKAGIPVIAQSAPGAVTDPSLPGYDSNVVNGFDQSAYYNVAAVAQVAPHSTYAILGWSAPVAFIKYWDQRIRYWATKFGLKFVGEEDVAADDSPSSSSTSMAATLANWPKVGTVFAWNDSTAEAGAATARSSGKNVRVTGENGDNTAIQMVKQGLLFSTFDNNWTAIWKQAVDGLYDELTHQHLPLPKVLSPLGTLVVQSNAGNVTSDSGAHV